jgi:glycerol uptake facilitator-like aquaporin
MSNEQPRRRRPAPKDVGAEHFTHPDGSASLNRSGNLGNAILYAPFDRVGSYAGILTTGLLMEMIGTFLFSFFTNMVLTKVGTTVPMDPTLNGFLVAIVSAGTYFMAAGGWRIADKNPENELPRHLSWSISFANVFVLRTGLFVLLGYLVAQTAGSLIAAWLLHVWVGPTDIALALPPNTISVSLWWGAEILGSGLIVFSYIYNQYFGGDYYEEIKQRGNAVLCTAMVRFGLMIIFFPFHSFYFDPVLYLTTLVGSCTSSGGCVDNIPFANAPVFYILVPLLGAFIAVLFYYLFLAIGYVSRRNGNWQPKNNVTLASAGQQAAAAVNAQFRGQRVYNNNPNPELVLPE